MVGWWAFVLLYHDFQAGTVTLIKLSCVFKWRDRAGFVIVVVVVVCLFVCFIFCRFVFHE